MKKAVSLMMAGVLLLTSPVMPKAALVDDDLVEL